MAAKPINMCKVKQIVKLKQQGISLSKISRSLNISRNTVKKYLRLIEVKKLTFEQILSKEDLELEALFYEDKRQEPERLIELEKLFPKYKNELKRPGVNNWFLWGEYRSLYPGGYSYSHFCYHFHNWLKNNDAVMHFEHEPADKLFIDFAGKKLYITDRETGEITDVEVYVSVLGYSQKTYVEAITSQKKDDFLNATQNALQFYGGVPQVLIPDNLKSAVTKANKYEAELNESFADLANHYGCAVLPTRSLKPRDKALVEKHVSIVYSRIYAPLRDRVFFSIKQLNQAIWELLDKHNNTNFQKEKISREEKFQIQEKQKLQPLPQQRYEIKHYKQVTVMKNCHVHLSDDKHYYSVPFRYIGKKVKIVYTSSSVSIFYKSQRIAFHQRNLKAYVYSTIKEHLPSTHQFVADWNPDKFINWANKISPQVKDYIVKIIDKKTYPEQSYRSCVGILSYAEKYSKQRLIDAIERAQYFGAYSYKTIKNIIEGKLDTLKIPDQVELEDQLPEHDNLRIEFK